MILLGQYDSPFVRRVAITLRLYGIPYEHRRWSVWGDADKIAQHNPLRRAPTLLLDDGMAPHPDARLTAPTRVFVRPQQVVRSAAGP